MFFTMGILSRHATTQDFVSGATFTVDCEPAKCAGSTKPACCTLPAGSVESAIQVYDDVRGSVTGGYQMLMSDEPGHIYRLDVQASGYASSVIYFSLGVDRMFHRDIYMIPETGSSFFVLNWGDSPSDLDAYLFPVRIKDPSSPSTPLAWHRLASEERPTEWVPIPLRDVYGIPTKETFSNWEQSRIQYKTAGQNFIPADEACVGKDQTCITLARDDTEHGQLVNGFINNGPEITSITNVPAGNYRYFVNVYKNSVPTDEFSDEELTVDVVVGNNKKDGTRNVLLKDTVKWSKVGGKWLYVGYLQVRIAALCVALKFLRTPSPLAFPISKEH
jgi:hypothetical protein